MAWGEILVKLVNVKNVARLEILEIAIIFLVVLGVFISWTIYGAKKPEASAQKDLLVQHGK